MKIIFLFILFCFGCSANRQLDTFGDASLKKVKHGRENYYIGFAESNESMDKAFFGALNNAQTIIAHELGVTVRTSITAQFDMQQTNLSTETSTILHKDIRLDSEHEIKAKITRMYHEKDKTHKFWVELYFDKKAFYKRFNDYWENELSAIKNNNNYIQNLEKLNELKDKFENEKKYLSPASVKEYNQLFSQNENKLHQKIEVNNINNSYKFSNEFSFKFTEQNTKEILKNFPIKINGTIYTSNNQGIVNYTADYDKSITILKGHKLDYYYPPRSLQIYFNDTFSPHSNNNVSLKIDSSDQYVKNTFTTLLRNKLFRVDNDYDVQVNITPQLTTQQISINQYLVNLKYIITLTSKNTSQPTIVHIPSDRNEYIKGHGNTETVARNNAYNMEWYSKKDQDIDKLINEIRKQLTGQRVKG